MADIMKGLSRTHYCGEVEGVGNEVTVGGFTQRIRDKGKKKLGDGDDDAVMDNIRQWRKSAIEKVMRRENATSGGHYDERGVFVYDDWRAAPKDGEPSQKERRRKK